ncbi:MAG TPA: WYL domain-containing protein [Usitatibacter sp.]|nr:WYL domain-containing protein [Usitatibacter sp.]
MRAGRLLQVLMLLQEHGRMSARRLAEAVEVSVRTVHRDIEELSASGVPVVAERGAAGGFTLLEGWRTRLTGLTPVEASVMSSLPGSWQADSRRVASRFHLDPIGWYRAPARADHLSAVARAVWHERRLRIRYDSWKGVSERRIEPLGLVLKGGEWYVVAASGKGTATYKVSNILTVEDMKETFRRPQRFDLAAYWSESIQRFEAGLYRGTAVLRASPAGMKRLSYLSDAVAKAVERASGKADRRGWREVTIPIESVEHAALELLRVGAECEVVSPAALRERMARNAEMLSKLYRRVRK